MDAYLKIHDLWKKFGNFVALRNISLDVYEGEFICFLGPSGCGKTTLLRAIAGLDIQTSGAIYQTGKDISGLPAAERDFGIVFQSYALFPNLTARENIAFGLKNIKNNKQKIAKRVIELLSLVDLSEHAMKYPAQLSGGQQQRIALARALAMSPGLLLLDEPLSALDARVRVHLRHEIKELQCKLGITTIMVTHDQEEALSMADRIVVMNHGIIEQVGTPNEIYALPTSLFVTEFIGETNKFAGIFHNNTVTLGQKLLTVSKSRYRDACNEGDMVDIVVRPEDIVPHGTADSQWSSQAISTNGFEMQIKEMEFMGSFWRTYLNNDDWVPTNLIANFSINAVRRLKLKNSGSLIIEIPPEYIKIFNSTNQIDKADKVMHI